MGSHSKDEVASALFRQPLSGGLNFSTPSLVPSSNPGSNPGPSMIPATVTVTRSNTGPTCTNTPAASQGTSIAGGFQGLHISSQPRVSCSNPGLDLSSVPLTMPGMIPGIGSLGMSMVMCPVLVPLQNGPPIIFNVPMVYPSPNILNTSSSGSTSVTSVSSTTTPIMSIQSRSTRLRHL